MRIPSGTWKLHTIKKYIINLDQFKMIFLSNNHILPNCEYRKNLNFRVPTSIPTTCIFGIRYPTEYFNMYNLCLCMSVLFVYAFWLFFFVFLTSDLVAISLFYLFDVLSWFGRYEWCIVCTVYIGDVWRLYWRHFLSLLFLYKLSIFYVF